MDDSIKILPTEIIATLPWATADMVTKSSIKSLDMLCFMEGEVQRELGMIINTGRSSSGQSYDELFEARAGVIASMRDLWKMVYPEAKFSPGRPMVTSGAMEAISRFVLTPEQVAEIQMPSSDKKLGVFKLVSSVLHQAGVLYRRHLSMDWGDVDEEDKMTNSIAVDKDLRLLSVYNLTQIEGGVEKLYLITEHDRSYSTLMKASEY